MGRTSAESERWLKTLSEWLKPLEMPIHYVVGNHDIVGWGKDGSSDATDPHFGKKAFADRFLKGPTYRSFNRGGWHFILMDSIQGPATPDPWPYRSQIDPGQLEWLKGDLATLKPGTPIVVAVHSPLMSGYHTINDGTYEKPQARMLIENGKQLHEILKPYPVKAVLQGHTHIRENLLYNGCQHITSGAVCGNWWNGSRFGVDPAGYSVCDLSDQDLTWQYLPSGWPTTG
jgi:3',5'-cyclic AMP phosphodiesterase CpdA